MNWTLGFYPFIAAVVTIAAITAIGIFNMHLLVRHKRNRLIVGIHIVSLLTAIGLASHMMSAAVFVLPLSQIYDRLARVFLLLAALGAVAAVVSALSPGKKYRLWNLPHSISDALSSIEEIVFVVDSSGAITHINHPAKYRSLLGDIDTMDRLLTFLHKHDSPRGDTPSGGIMEAAAYELYSAQNDTHSLLRISPLVIGNSRLGYTAVLEDISAIRTGESALREQNEYLERANTKLTNSIKAAGALEAEQERLRILEQVQRILIQDMENALSSVRDMKRHCFEDLSYREAAKELAAQLRLIYQKVRRTVGQITGKGVSQ